MMMLSSAEDEVTAPHGLRGSFDPRGDGNFQLDLSVAPSDPQPDEAAGEDDDGVVNFSGISQRFSGAMR